MQAFYLRRSQCLDVVLVIQFTGQYQKQSSHFCCRNAICKGADLEHPELATLQAFLTRDPFARNFVIILPMSPW